MNAQLVETRPQPIECFRGLGSHLLALARRRRPEPVEVGRTKEAPTKQVQRPQQESKKYGRWIIPPADSGGIISRCRNYRPGRASHRSFS
jgi:hypothetical protein